MGCLFVTSVFKSNADLTTNTQLLSGYEYMRNDVLATGIMSFVMHEIVYFGRSLPWIIIDQIPYFRRWKIQNVILQRRNIPTF